MYVLLEEGELYLKKGLPEKQLIKILSKGVKKIHDIDMENLSIAIKWAKQKGWIEIRNNEIILKKPIEEIEKDREIENALYSIKHNKSIDYKLAKILLSRKLIKEKRMDVEEVAKQFKGKTITTLHPSLLITKQWRNVKFKPYDIKAGKVLQYGRKHIISLYIEKIRNVMFDMGFQESCGPIIEISFWNFDALYQPQDHPARDLADTFYLKKPSYFKLPKKDLVDRVKSVHENGWKTGSSGWKYRWDEDVAKKPVLRTHTTAVSARMLTRIKPPTKIFTIGRVFRNETIDYKHLPEFTQIEGIVVDENVSFRDLLGYLKIFYEKIGFKKIRFRPAYFPYTEMSVEPEVYFKEKKTYIELGGAGIFRPEVTEPLGIKVPVLAWGLGLERMIMLKHGITDIRNFYYKNDLKYLRSLIWQ